MTTLETQKLKDKYAFLETELEQRVPAPTLRHLDKFIEKNDLTEKFKRAWRNNNAWFVVRDNLYLGAYKATGDSEFAWLVVDAVQHFSKLKTPAMKS